MTRIVRTRFTYLAGVWMLGLVVFVAAGCSFFSMPETSHPNWQDTGSPPALSNLAVSPNPTYAGNVINLTANYVDPDGDLEFGVAIVAVEGKNLSRIAFRSSYISGLLTIPVLINYYSLPSDIQVSLKIRDSSGHWSNTVSTTLSVR